MKISCVKMDALTKFWKLVQRIEDKYSISEDLLYGTESTLETSFTLDGHCRLLCDDLEDESSRESESENKDCDTEAFVSLFSTVCKNRMNFSHENDLNLIEQEFPEYIRNDFILENMNRISEEGIDETNENDNEPIEEVLLVTPGEKTDQSNSDNSINVQVENFEEMTGNCIFTNRSKILRNDIEESSFLRTKSKVLVSRDLENLNVNTICQTDNTKEELANFRTFSRSFLPSSQAQTGNYNNINNAIPFLRRVSKRDYYFLFRTASRLHKHNSDACNLNCWNYSKFHRNDLRKRVTFDRNSLNLVNYASSCNTSTKNGSLEDSLPTANFNKSFQDWALNGFGVQNSSFSYESEISQKKVQQYYSSSKGSIFPNR